MNICLQPKWEEIIYREKKDREIWIYKKKLYFYQLTISLSFFFHFSSYLFLPSYYKTNIYPNIVIQQINPKTYSFNLFFFNALVITIQPLVLESHGFILKIYYMFSYYKSI